MFPWRISYPTPASFPTPRFAGICHLHVLSISYSIRPFYSIYFADVQINELS